MKIGFVMLTFAILLLTGCAPSATPTPILGIPLTEAPAMPTALPATVQAAQWKKYQTELARVLLARYNSKLGFPPDYYKLALCEWDVLGRATQIVYVWAYCGVPQGAEHDAPAVIYLNESGSPQKAEAPNPEIHLLEAAAKMFPADVLAKFETYTSPAAPRLREMMEHAHYRQTHPEEPPLIIRSATNP